MDTEKNLEAALFSLFWREGVQPQKTWIQKRIWKPRSSRFSCSRRKHGYPEKNGSRALLAFLAGRGAAAENMDTEKNLEAALFSLFWREGVQPQKTWIQKRIWKPRSSRFSGGMPACTEKNLEAEQRKHGVWKPRFLAFLAGRGAAAENMFWKPRSSRKGCSRRKHGYRKESGSRALLAFLAGRGAAAENMDTEKNLEAALFARGAAAENMDTEKNLEAALFSLFWREGVQPQKTWIQIVCQGLVQTGLALHPMSRNRWSLEISSLKMFRLQCGLFLTQDVSPAVWRWRLLNARCFACSFWMAPSCLPFEHCNINFSCHSNIALWSAIL